MKKLLLTSCATILLMMNSGELYGSKSKPETMQLSAGPFAGATGEPTRLCERLGMYMDKKALEGDPIALIDAIQKALEDSKKNPLLPDKESEFTQDFLPLLAMIRGVIIGSEESVRKTLAALKRVETALHHSEAEQGQLLKELKKSQHNEADIRDLKSKKDEAEKRLSQLSEELETTKSKLDEVIRENNKLQNQKIQAEKKSATLTREIEELQNENKRLSSLADIKEAQKQITDLQGEINRYRTENGCLKKQLEEQGEHASQSAAEKAERDLAQNQKEARKKMTRQEATIKELKEQVSQLTEELEQLQSAYKKLEEESKKTEEKLTKENKAKEAEIIGLQEQLNEKIRQLLQQPQQNRPTLPPTKKKPEQQGQGNPDTNSQLKKRLRELEAKYQTLQQQEKAQQEAAQKTITELQAEIERSSQAIVALQAKSEQDQKTSQEKDALIAALQAQRNVDQQTIAGQQAEIERLKKMLDEVQEKSSARSDSPALSYSLLQVHQQVFRQVLLNQLQLLLLIHKLLINYNRFLLIHFQQPHQRKQQDARFLLPLERTTEH